jgi:endoglucanase
MRHALIAFIFIITSAFSQGFAQTNASDGLKLDARPIPLGGVLRNNELWTSYKGQFISQQGRVIDTGNNLISHSESQGYGMLLAVAAGDRVAFELIWGWTRANLMVRDDQLVAWRWDPHGRPAVADMNNASDGDILIAWALAEAAELWDDMSYRVSARRIAVEIGRKLILWKAQQGAVLLPAVSAFSAEDRSDGPVINLSYWVFPAFARLSLVAPELDWSGLTQSGLAFVRAAHFGSSGLPSEWISAKGNTLRPADGFAPVFGYNAIRIPLYLAWAGIGERDNFSIFAKTWGRLNAIGAVYTMSGRLVEPMAEPGYRALAALIACVLEGTSVPKDLLKPAVENYYPATLRLLSVIAGQMRYASCYRT